MHVSSCIGVDHKVLWKSYVCKDRLYNVWKPRSCSIRSSRKSHFFRESFAYWSPWLKFKGWRLGIGTWCWLFYRTATEGPYEHAQLSTLQWSPARLFWRMAQLPTTSASHCRYFLILMSVPCDWHRWFMDFPHWWIATTWPRQERILLVSSDTDPRNTWFLVGEQLWFSHTHIYIHFICLYHLYTDISIYTYIYIYIHLVYLLIYI